MLGARFSFEALEAAPARARAGAASWLASDKLSLDPNSVPGCGSPGTGSLVPERLETGGW
jgi:hypothetical protein